MSPWDRSHDQYELARERTSEAKRWTHLANERTYAAWIRTALALIGLGVGIAGYFQIAGQERTFATLGYTFVVGGALMAALATYTYRKTYRNVEKGEFGGGLELLLLLGIIPVLLGIVALLLIILR
jgi:putative membrane protein